MKLQEEGQNRYHRREQAIEAVEASGTKSLNDKYASDMTELLPKDNINGEANEHILTMVVCRQ